VSVTPSVTLKPFMLSFVLLYVVMLRVAAFSLLGVNMAPNVSTLSMVCCNAEYYLLCVTFYIDMQSAVKQNAAMLSFMAPLQRNKKSIPQLLGT
jgi:hypothetical protein